MTSYQGETGNFDEGSGDIFEVENIIGAREVDGVVEYRVRWKGWGPEFDTWEPTDNLISCRDLLEKFIQSQQARAPAVYAGNMGLSSAAGIDLGIDPSDASSSRSAVTGVVGSVIGGGAVSADYGMDVKPVVHRIKMERRDIMQAEGLAEIVLADHETLQPMAFGDVGDGRSVVSSIASLNVKMEPEAPIALPVMKGDVDSMDDIVADVLSITSGGVGGGGGVLSDAGSGAVDAVSMMAGSISSSGTSEVTPPLKDPFWKNLEEGKIDLSENLYERVGRRAATSNIKSYSEAVLFKDSMNKQASPERDIKPVIGGSAGSSIDSALASIESEAVGLEAEEPTSIISAKVDKARGGKTAGRGGKSRGGSTTAASSGQGGARRQGRGSRGGATATVAAERVPPESSAGTTEPEPVAADKLLSDGFTISQPEPASSVPAEPPRPSSVTASSDAASIEMVNLTADAVMNLDVKQPPLDEPGISAEDLLSSWDDVAADKQPTDGSQPDAEKMDTTDTPDTGVTPSASPSVSPPPPPTRGRGRARRARGGRGKRGGRGAAGGRGQPAAAATAKTASAATARDDKDSDDEDIGFARTSSRRTSLRANRRLRDLLSSDEEDKDDDSAETTKDDVDSEWKGDKSAESDEGEPDTYESVPVGRIRKARGKPKNRREADSNRKGSGEPPAQGKRPDGTTSGIANKDLDSSRRSKDGDRDRDASPSHDRDANKDRSTSPAGQIDRGTRHESGSGGSRLPSDKGEIPERPSTPGDKKRSHRDREQETLPMQLEKDLNIGEYMRWEMRAYQREEGRALTDGEFADACLHGNLTAVRGALIAARRTNIALDVERADMMGNTILMQVSSRPCDAAHECDDILELLVQHNANVNVRNKNGDTALFIAAEKGYLCKVSKLLSLGAAANLSNSKGETPLSVACARGYSHVVYRLLEYGSDFHAVNCNGLTPFEVAKEVNQNQCAELVRAHVAKVKAVFDQELQSVLGGCIRLKRFLFPMHCYALNESHTFRVLFPFEMFNFPKDRDYGFLLFIGCAKFSSQQVNVRFWGPCPISSVRLNGTDQVPVQEEGRFLFSFWPLQDGHNDLVISCHQNKASQMKLLIQAFLVQVRNYSTDAENVPPMPQQMPL